MKNGYGQYSIDLNGCTYHSRTYKTDDRKGLPDDGSLGFIRYMNMEREGKVYKMKAGKMYKHIMDDSLYSRCIADEVKIYMCELFTQEWISYQQKFVLDNYNLYVDRYFEYIYNSENYVDGEDFHSCMTDKGYDGFYLNMKASAACLCNDSGYIIARCIVFNEVIDYTTGQVLRLAERQYAADGNLNYMRMLIDALIREGYIDGYKRIGMGCHDADAFVLNDGTGLEGHKMFIHLNIDADEQISYMDSFKYYDPEENRAWNDSRYGDFSLDTTCGEINGTHYDQYHCCNTFNDVVECRYEGGWIEVDEYRLEDFEELDGYYYHYSEICECPVCGFKFHFDYGYYSCLTEESYCCSTCRNDAEDIYEMAQKEHEAYAEQTA